MCKGVVCGCGCRGQEMDIDRLAQFVKFPRCEGGVGVVCVWGQELDIDRLVQLSTFPGVRMVCGVSVCMAV